MRILFISQYYPPEIGAPSARVSELAKLWAQAGHEVTVLTGFPNHPTGRVYPGYEGKLKRLTMSERLDGYRVLRTWLWPLPNRKPLERIINYTSFCVSAILRGIFLRRPDIIIATSPQLLVGVSGRVLARIKRVPWIFEVRDLWPDAILASGVGKPGSRFARTLASISRYLYKTSDRIVVVTPAFKQDLIAKGVPGDKMEIVTNGVDLELFKGATERERDDPFRIAYIGTLGFAHGLQTLLDAAVSMRESGLEVEVLLVGEGAERDRLEARIHNDRLTNVRLVGQLPRSEIPGVLDSVDVGIVLLKKADNFTTVIPTKMLEFMAAGKPVVLGVDGQARTILEEAGAGFFVEPENHEELVSAVVRLLHQPDRGRAMGRRGRDYIEKNLTRQRTADDYLVVLSGLRQRLAASRRWSG